jgi:hypothetical protein
MFIMFCDYLGCKIALRLVLLVIGGSRLASKPLASSNATGSIL